MSNRCNLTDKQIHELSLTLADTSNNVYTVAKRKFGTEVGEEVFDKLYDVAKLFRCEECSVWLSTDLEEPRQKGFCTDCVDEMNEDDDTDTYHDDE